MAKPRSADRRASLPSQPRRRAQALTAMLAAAGVPAFGDPNPSPGPGPGPGPVAYEFSSDLLAGGVGSKLDVSRFALGNPQLAGNYRVDVYLNSRWLQRRDIRLAGTPAEPCIDADLIRLSGIALSALTPQGAALVGPRKSEAGDAIGTCRTMASLAPDVQVQFDAGELRLDITVPQASLARQPKGYVPAEAWDRGVTAASLTYNLNAYRASSSTSKDSSVFLGLNAGFNLGRWRLRHNGSFNHSDVGGSRYSGLGTFASTDLPSWEAVLTVGDSYTSGQLFPSAKLRGVGIATDERMSPESRRGYAPVIRGIANSNARVEIRQNNAVLYSTSVPPGPFEINDLYPTGYGGDLQVVVTESDGSQRTTNVPYSSLPQLLRMGVGKFSLQAGRVLGYQGNYELIQATAQYGLSNDLTLAGGAQLAERYAALLAGGAWNTPLGAFQSNITTANFQRTVGRRLSGWSLDASWAKVLPATNTNLSFAAYRYSSSGFYSLDDALRQRDIDSALPGFAPSFRLRNRAILTVSQSFSRGLTFNVSASSQDYWDLNTRQTAYQFGFYKQIGQALLAVSGTSVRNLGDAAARRLYTIGLTLPFGGPGGTRNNITSSYAHDSLGGSNRQAGFFGNYGERGEVSYGLSYQGNGSGHTLLANGGYMGKYAILGANASTGRGVNQQSVTASGGLVAADGHLVFAPFIGDTVGLVRVTGAEGLRVEASQASELDSSGYTLVPYLSPYTANTVELNLNKAPLSARFDSTSATVAPHAGAVVLLQFNRLAGYTLMLRARRDDGSVVPFGATVYDAAGALVGSVAQAGRIEAGSDSLSGQLRVTWGDDAGSSCIVNYDLPKPEGGQDAIVQAQVRCSRDSGGRPGALRAEVTPAVPSAGADAQAAATVSSLDRRPALIGVSDGTGQPLPDGTEVSLADRPDSVGVVSRGRVVVRLLPAQAGAGRLVARWTTSDGAARACALDLAVSASANASSSAPLHAHCAVQSAGVAPTLADPRAQP